MQCPKSPSMRLLSRVICHICHAMAEPCPDWDDWRCHEADTSHDRTDTLDTWHFIAAQIWRQEANTRLEAAPDPPSDERWIEMEADIVSHKDCINHAWYISTMVSDCELDMFDLYHFDFISSQFYNTQTQSEIFPMGYYELDHIHSLGIC